MLGQWRKTCGAWGKRLGAVWLVLCAAAPVRAQDDSFQPIIQLETSLKMESLKQEALWDQEFRKSRTRNKYAIKGLRNQIKQLEKSVAKGKKESKAADMMKLLEAYVNLYNYEMALPADKDGKRANRLDELLRKTARLASDLTEYAAKPKEKARAAFHAQVAKYYARATDFNVNELDAYKRDMPRDLAVQTRLLDAIDAVEKGTEASRYAAIKRLEPYTRLMNEREAIVSNLIIAQTLANIDGEGNLVRDPGPEYKPYLTKATELGAKLPKTQKREVFLYALSLWRIAERDQGSWETLPVDLGSFQDMPEIKSARERVAISLAFKKSYMPAAKIYQEIRQIYAKTPLVLKIDDRLLNLYRYDYIATGNPKAYQSLLANLQKRYTNPKATHKLPEKDVKAFLDKMESYYQELASNEANRGLDEKAGEETRTQALGVLNARLRTAKSAGEKENIQYQMASLLVIAKNYQGAHEIFLKLANDAAVPKANKPKYMLLAVQTRQAALNWPSDNPFPVLADAEPLAEDRAKDLADLLALTKTYYAMAKGQKDTAWITVAHIGVLEAKLGKPDETVKLWWDMLKRDAKGPVAQEAAGQAIKLLRDGGKWADLEAFTRFLAEKDVQPGLNGKAVALAPVQAQALFQAALQEYKAKDYAKASKRFAEYVTNHGNEKNHDEAMVRLAESYRKAGQHVKALGMFFDLAEAHPKSPYARKALATGGDYALGLGLEEEAVKMYEQFLKVTREGPAVAVVADKLARLHVALSRIDQATAVLVSVLKRKTLIPEQANAMGSLLVDIQARYGSPKQALRVAEFLKKVNPESQLAEVKIALFQARQMVDGNYDAKRAAALDKLLNAMPEKPDEALVEDLAEIRFVLADKRGEDLLDKLDNVASDNPLKGMEKVFKSFKAMEIAYLKVCDMGENSFCGPSQYKLYKLADQFVAGYGEFDAADVLKGKRLASFNARREALVKEVEQIREASRDIALKEVGKGQTSPEWAQEIAGIGKRGGVAELAGGKAKLFAQVDTKAKDKVLKREKSAEVEAVADDGDEAAAAVKAKDGDDAPDADADEAGDEAEAPKAKKAKARKAKAKKAKAKKTKDDGDDEDWE